MLSYAYKSLSFSDYQNLSAEKFDNLTDLYTEILIIAYRKIIKQGPYKEYIPHQEDSMFVKGKINLRDSMRTNNIINSKVAVEYEVLSEDNLPNQIIKSTFLKLVYSAQLSAKQLKAIKEILLYLTEVSSITLTEYSFSQVRYNNQNRHYELPIDIAKFLYDSMLISDEAGSHQLKEIKDEQALSSLFENFVYAFYHKETDWQVSRPKIHWDVDDGYNEALPVMQTDIVLKKDHQTIIIDTKFYQQNMKSRYENGPKKHLTGNLYQLFTYLENYQRKDSETVSGMLLYAMTNDKEQPNNEYVIKGKKVKVKHINLSQEMNQIIIFYFSTLH